MQVLLLFTNLLSPLGAYLLVAELDMPIRLLAYGGAQSAHTKLYDGTGRVPLVGVVLGVEVVVVLADFREWVWERSISKPKMSAGSVWCKDISSDVMLAEGSQRSLWVLGGSAKNM